MGFNINSKIIQFKTILTKAGISEQSKTIVASFTNGRATSSKMMTLTEINRAIEVLQKQYPSTASVGAGFTPAQLKPGDKMRKKILGMAHDLGWQVLDTKTGKFKADLSKINRWCIEKGAFKKALNSHSEAELVKLVSQFGKVSKSVIDKMGGK